MKAFNVSVATVYIYMEYCPFRMPSPPERYYNTPDWRNQLEKIA